MQFLLFPSCSTLLLLLCALPARADWMADVGYVKLQAELGAACPKGVGVKFTQVEVPEPGGAYAPMAGYGNVPLPGTVSFIGQTFLLKSGDSAASTHAQVVGSRAYSIYGLASGVANVDVYDANHWLFAGFLNYPTPEAPQIVVPLSESSHVQNHAWIANPSDSSPGQIAAFNNLLHRVDYSINADSSNRYLCCAGMNNYVGSAFPVMMASAFNVLAVGRSDGQHSQGVTSSSFDGGGRSKPEIVAPSDATSFATGMVSGAGAVLRGVATTANGQRTETLRAVLLAGATKEEFPAWTQTSTKPIDGVYGAGELNIYNSYKILIAPEQTAHVTNPVTLTGWQHKAVLPNSTNDYILNIPASKNGGSLSAALVWNRQVTFNGSGFTHVSPPNLRLTLYKGPNNPGTQVYQSDSAVDNLEHIWRPLLLCGTYRLRVNGGAFTTQATLAWRYTPPVASPGIKIISSSPIVLGFDNLVLTQPYLIQVSTDLNGWSTAHNFTASSSTLTWNAPAMVGGRCFYRLKWTCP